MVLHGSYPPGYRFFPTDEELVAFYLRNKLMNLPLPCHNKIKDVNIYKFHPQHLQDNYKDEGDKFMYFFSPRDRKYPQGNRPNRSAGDGYWKATGVDHVIKQDNIRIGTRKTLVYHEGKAKEQPVKTSWIMHEYRTMEQDQSSRKTRNPTSPYKTKTSPSSNTMMLDACVLCKIYNRLARKSENADDDTGNTPDSTSSESLEQSNNGSEYVSDNVGSTSIVPCHHNFHDFTNFGPPLQGPIHGSEPYNNVGYSSFISSPMQTTHNVGFGGSVIPLRRTLNIDFGSSSRSVIPMQMNVGSSSSVIPMQTTHNIHVGSSSSSVIPMQMNAGSGSSLIPMQTTRNIHVGSSSFANPMRISHDINVGSTSFAAQLQRTHEYPAPVFSPRPINHQMCALQGNLDYFNALDCTNSATPAQRTEESNGSGSVGSTISTLAMQGNEANNIAPTPRNVTDNSATAPPMSRIDDGNMQDHSGSSNLDEFDCLSFLNNDEDPLS